MFDYKLAKKWYFLCKETFPDQVLRLSLREVQSHFLSVELYEYQKERITHSRMHNIIGSLDIVETIMCYYPFLVNDLKFNLENSYVL